MHEHDQVGDSGNSGRLKRFFRSRAEYSSDTFVVSADFASFKDPDYLRLFHQYPFADGIRDMSIMLDFPSDTEALIKDAKEGGVNFAVVGWLIFHSSFVRAAEKKGMTAQQYADYLYDLCEKTNESLGRRVAWIEAYGEIGDSCTWPKGRKFTKREALDYFRSWMRDGRMNSTHWGKLVSSDAPCYYTHALYRNKDLRELPICYTDGTLYAIHEAFRMGFPLVIYEAQCGSMDSTQHGIAFVRGGAKMYDCWWGCDFSPHPHPQVSPHGALLSGIVGAPDHFFRSWLASFMSGANMIYHEGSWVHFYSNPGTGFKIPSEYGYKAMQFHALTRSCLEDRGVPLSPFAIMLEEANGYRSTACREYDEKGNMSFDLVNDNPANRLNIWAGSTEVGPEDWGIFRLLRTIWPVAPGKFADLGNRTWPDSPSVAVCEPALITDFHMGKDAPREYHRWLDDNRWTDAFDIIPEESPAERISKYYKVLILTGGIKTHRWDEFSPFVSDGGTVVLSIANLTDNVRGVLGIRSEVKLEETLVTDVMVEGGMTVPWLWDKLSLYKGPTGDATVWARDGNKNPLIVRYSYGKGEIYLLLFPYGTTANTEKLFAAYTCLLDFLHRKHVGVWHNGPLCQMLVNVRRSDTLVTVMNQSGETWRGDVTIRREGKPVIKETRDLMTGTLFPSEMVVADNEKVTARVIVAPWEARIVSFGECPAKHVHDEKKPDRSEDEKAMARILASDPSVTLK